MSAFWPEDANEDWAEFEEEDERPVEDLELPECTTCGRPENLTTVGGRPYCQRHA